MTESILGLLKIGKRCPGSEKAQPCQTKSIITDKYVQALQYQCILYIELQSYAHIFNSAKIVTLLLKYVGYTVPYMQSEKEKKHEQQISAEILYKFQKLVLVHQEASCFRDLEKKNS